MRAFGEADLTQASEARPGRAVDPGGTPRALGLTSEIALILALHLAAALAVVSTLAALGLG